MTTIDIRREVRRALEAELLNFNEWKGTPIKYEVIIAYDIVDDPFRKNLYEFIKNELQYSIRLSESAYLLKDKYTIEKIHELMEQIIEKYTILLESKQAATESIVRVILPNGDDFKVWKLKFPVFGD